MRLRKIKGLTLIEVAMALAIATLSFLFLARLMADSSSSAQAAADAKKMTMMAKAAQTYLNVEAADLKAFITSPTQVIAIPLARNSEGQLPPDGPHATLPSVQKAGLLATEFIDSNALGQRHVLLVKEPVADKLEGLVVSYGGTAMQDTQLGKVIQSFGMAGGGVFAKDVAPITTTPIANANITGHAGGWTLPVASWSGANLSGTPVTPSAGRPVVSLAMMDVVDNAVSPPPVTPPPTSPPPAAPPAIDLHPKYSSCPVIPSAGCGAFGSGIFNSDGTSLQIAERCVQGGEFNRSGGADYMWQVNAAGRWVNCMRTSYPSYMVSSPWPRYAQVAGPYVRKTFTCEDGGHGDFYEATVTPECRFQNGSPTTLSSCGNTPPSPIYRVEYRKCQ